MHVLMSTFVDSDCLLKNKICQNGHWFGAKMLRFEEIRILRLTSEGQVNIIMAKCRWEGKRSIDEQSEL